MCTLHVRNVCEREATRIDRHNQNHFAIYLYTKNSKRYFMAGKTKYCFILELCGKFVFFLGSSLLASDMLYNTHMRCVQISQAYYYYSLLLLTFITQGLEK